MHTSLQTPLIRKLNHQLINRSQDVPVVLTDACARHFNGFPCEPKMSLTFREHPAEPP